MPVPDSAVEDRRLLYQGAEARLYIGKWKLESDISKDSHNITETQYESVLIKQRFSKGYRDPVLDGVLTKSRFKAEIRMYKRCAEHGIRTPRLVNADSRTNEIVIEWLQNCETMRDYIQRLYAESKAVNNGICRVVTKFGTVVARLHVTLNVCHGDLTTSNVLIDSQFGGENINAEEAVETIHAQSKKIVTPQIRELVLIDFGLSHGSSFSSCLESRAVDLYVLESAFFSTHPQIATSLFEPYFMTAYKTEYRRLRELANDQKSDDSVERFTVEAVLKKFEQVRSRGRKRSLVG